MCKAIGNGFLFLADSTGGSEFVGKQSVCQQKFCEYVQGSNVGRFNAGQSNCPQQHDGLGTVRFE
jgi:hypothetical protein